MQELPFLHSARRLMLIDICKKFHEDSLMGFQVTERTRFVTDRQTDGRTDGRMPGKNNMSPNPEGGGGHKNRQHCFLHYNPMGAICCHGNQSFDPI